ncbi:MAG: riboflavin synthase, partial [Candidatus Aenigmatarchaeota archaeon]
MFTGIVEDTAEVTEVAEAEEGRRISLESDCLDGVERGESVSVSGACLTVEEHDEDRAKFFLGAETLEKTWFD